MSKVLQNFPQYVTATVPVTTKVSNEVDLQYYDLVGIITPATFDGTDITFTGASASGGTYVTVAASNAAATAYTIITTASIFTPINPTIFDGLRFIKVNTTTTQGTTDSVFTLALRLKTA